MLYILNGRATARHIEDRIYIEYIRIMAVKKTMKVVFSLVLLLLPLASTSAVEVKFDFMYFVQQVMWTDTNDQLNCELILYIYIVHLLTN